MIKLCRGPRPAKLTKERAKKLTQEFLLNNTSVWNIPYIKNALMQMSHGKCCYCECCVTEDSNYMEIEHFHDKSTYPKEVVVWENLLPSCKHCNVNKGTYNTKTNEFINPSTDEPKDHMVLINSIVYKAKENDIQGENTIRELDINDSERLCVPRIKIVQGLNEKLCSIYKSCRLWKLDGLDSDREDIQKGMMDLLHYCAPECPYSAVKTTYVLNNDKYISIKQFMQNNAMWLSDMDEAERHLEWSRYELEEVPV